MSNSRRYMEQACVYLCCHCLNELWQLHWIRQCSMVCSGRSRNWLVIWGWSLLCSSQTSPLCPFTTLTSLSFPTAPLNSDRFLQNAVSSPACLGEAWSTNVFLCISVKNLILSYKFPVIKLNEQSDWRYCSRAKNAVCRWKWMHPVIPPSGSTTNGLCLYRVGHKLHIFKSRVRLTALCRGLPRWTSTRKVETNLCCDAVRSAAGRASGL